MISDRVQILDGAQENEGLVAEIADMVSRCGFNFSRLEMERRGAFGLRITLEQGDNRMMVVLQMGAGFSVEKMRAQFAVALQNWALFLPESRTKPTGKNLEKTGLK